MKLGRAENYIFSELKQLDEAGRMKINTIRFFHKLKCEQLEKFVDVREAIRDELKKLPSKFAQELKKVIR